MTTTFTRQLLSTVLSSLLILAPAVQAAAQQAPSTEYSGQGAPLTAAELEQLVAPIALYPDALVAQVLGAATFPDQVAFASDWLQQDKNLTGTALMQAVDTQQWDPSVKALTQFPSVLDNLAKNLSWTSALGEAYHTQSAEVMAAVQTLRAKAKAAGNLKSGSQIVVEQQSPQVIVIQPANPQVVYVPVYNPTVVYGYPYVVPGYVAPPAATAVLAFGVGIAVGAMVASSHCCGWGYSYWNCNWHSTTVVYHGGSYYGNAAWHGGYYGTGGVAHYGTSYNSATGTYARGASVSNGYGTAKAGQAYNPSTGTYARGGSVSNAYGTQGAAQAYNPRTGAYGATEQGSNANGSWGSSTVSKNGNTAYSQHQTTAQGTTGSVQTSNGGKAAGASGKYNSAAVAQTANGNKYASANGNVYSNTGSGWKGNSNNTPKSGSTYSSDAAAKGWGQQEKSSGSSAFSSGGGGWQSRSASARGSASRGGGGGWGGGHYRR
jgi:Protein of unknown function (DUF3300)